MTHPSAEFGPTLRSLRRELQLSQESLAEAVGSTQRHVSFLETGRSAPTRSMLGRLVAGLRLTAAQRAALFEASGFRSPYPARDLAHPEVQATIDLLARQVLRHWPFPGFIVDQDWQFLRANDAGQRMIELFEGPPDMYSLFLSPSFRQVVQNWEQASGSFYTRIQEVARRSPRVRDALDRAVAEGQFDHVSRVLAGREAVPIYIPFVVQLPDGPPLRFSSLHGRLVSVHDAVAERFEVELMVPLDEATENALLQVFAGH